MPLTPGTRLGPYEVVSALGAGGMGEVYRARDPRFGREVALKILSSEFAEDRDRMRRFEQEARAAGALNHPHILAVYDAGERDGSPYMVSELLEGQTLRDRMAGGPLGVRKSVEIAVQIARGLAAAHEKGIVHRDLKPENIFLTRDGRVKILDFGLAKMGPAAAADEGSATRTRGTDPGTVLGTAGYMSPEQVRGQAVDHRTDLFALGAILYEMLTGRKAFRRDTPADTLAAILHEELPDLTAIQPGLPAALERIVRHCLEKERDERFASARDLAFDLEALTDAGTGPSRVQRGWTRGWAWRKALPLLLWTALVSGASLWWARRLEPVPPTYRQLTFRTGTVTNARFSPDGSYFLYSAAWSGGPARLYSTRLDVPGDNDLGLEGDFVGVTKDAVLVIRPDHVLVRANLAGQGPREVAENVWAADASAAGDRIVAVRRMPGRDVVESPPGKVIHETSGRIYNVRISPAGDRVALLEAAQPGIVPTRVGVLTPGGPPRWLTPVGIFTAVGWSPDGAEIWVTMRQQGRASLQAVSLSGRQRTLLTAPQEPILHDVRLDGRWLVSFTPLRKGVLRGMTSGMTEEAEFAHLGGAQCFEISPDGRTLVLSTSSSPAAVPQSVYLGSFGESPPVRLGPGFSGGLSPDGRLLAVMGDNFTTLDLVPTGAGDTRRLPAGSIRNYFDVRFRPDGRSLLIAASEADRPRRLFLQDVAGGDPRPVSPEGVDVLYAMPSPDGRWVVAGPDWRATPDLLHPLEGGGEPRPIPGLAKGEQALRFDADGTHVFIRTDAVDRPFARIARLDIRTGRREAWKEIRPPDTRGVATIDFVFLGPGGRSYSYFYIVEPSTLFLVEGVP